MEKETALRIKISEAATNRYIKNDRFTIQSLAEDIKMDSKQIFDLFPNRSSILRYYYESRLIIYREQLDKIDGYSNFSLSEKLSNFFISILDQFQDQREFILISYKKMLIQNCDSPPFEQQFKKELKNIFTQDDNISISSKPFINKILYHTIYIQFHGLIWFWSKDESRQNENCLALIDKWSNLTEEAFYSKILDKGFDFGKFLIFSPPFSKYRWCDLQSEDNKS
jgi:hypothetical protein